MTTCDIITCAVCTVLLLSVTASYSTAPCFIVQLSGKQEVQTKVILIEKGGPDQRGSSKGERRRGRGC